MLDRQPFSRRSLRRCARIRDRLSHHSLRRSLSILRSQDRPLTLGQAHRRGGLVKRRRLVGSSEQADEGRRKSSPHFLRIKLLSTSNRGIGL